MSSTYKQLLAVTRLLLYHAHAAVINSLHQRIVNKNTSISAIETEPTKEDIEINTMYTKNIKENSIAQYVGNMVICFFYIVTMKSCQWLSSTGKKFIQNINGKPSKPKD